MMKVRRGCWLAGWLLFSPAAFYGHTTTQPSQQHCSADLDTQHTPRHPHDTLIHT